MRDRILRPVRADYLSLRSVAFDDVLEVDGRRASIEQSWRIARTESLERRLRIARAVIDTLGVRESVDLLWVHPVDGPPSGLYEPLILLLGMGHPAETADALDSYIEAWLDEASADRWLGVGLGIVFQCAVFARIGVDLSPADIGDLVAALHEDPPRARTVEAFTALLLLSLPDRQSAAVWDALGARYAGGRDVMLGRWREPLAPRLGWPSREELDAARRML